jgi:hypothetical protein
MEPVEQQPPHLAQEDRQRRSQPGGQKGIDTQPAAVRGLERSGCVRVQSEQHPTGGAPSVTTVLP